jgi:hypothetical protein
MGLKAGIHMTVAGTIAYKLLAHATYLHVHALTGMPVSATQVDSTFDLLACNLREGRGGYETGMFYENIVILAFSIVWQGPEACIQ